MSQNDRARLSALHDLRVHIEDRTGMHPGDIEVTCPVCFPVVSFKGKFCPSCRREVTSLSYEFIQSGLTSGRLLPESILDCLETIPDFSKGSKIAKTVFDRKQSELLIFED